VRSSADVERALASAADAVLHAAAPYEDAVILIDGRSGAGKSTLARIVTARRGGELLALDSVYPGWDGLDAGVRLVTDGVLRPRKAGRAGRWHRWDWDRHRTAEAHDVPAEGTLVVEGSGILTPESRALSDVQVWLESPAISRRRRALDRDGDVYRPHWDQWAAQEEAHLRAHDPAALASVVIVVP